jgi:hypothetical protein
MSDLPTAVSASELCSSFPSETIQVCVVSRDHRRTMAGMTRLAIGPWRVYPYRAAPGARTSPASTISIPKKRPRPPAKSTA